MPHLSTYFPFDLKQTCFQRCLRCSAASYVDSITDNFAGLILWSTSLEFVIDVVYLLEPLMQFDHHQSFISH